MATTALNVKDPLIDEDEIIKAAQPESYEVQTRAFLDNVGADYNLSSADLGWKKVDGVGQILLNGNPFTTADRVENGISFVDNEKIKADFDNYVKTYSLKSTSDLEQETLDKYKIGNYGYNDPFEDTMKGLLEQILNPKPFSYDSATDPSFKSYEQQYNRQGDRALTNTMSEASALTGGRLNSWAVSAGQQAKENFDQKLMDVIPQLENMAYNRYQDGISNKRSDFNTLLDVDNEAFRRASDERSFAYGTSADVRENARLAEETKYNRNALKEQTTYDRGRDVKADANYLNEWNHTVEQDKFNNSMDIAEFQWDMKMDADTNARGWAQYNLSKSNAAFDNAMALKNYGLNLEEFELRKAKDLAELANQVKEEEDKFLLGTIYHQMMSMQLTDLDGLPNGKAATPAEWLTEMGPEIPDDIFKILWPYANQKDNITNLYVGGNN